MEAYFLNYSKDYMLIVHKSNMSIMPLDTSSNIQNTSLLNVLCVLSGNLLKVTLNCKMGSKLI